MDKRRYQVFLAALSVAVSAMAVSPGTGAPQCTAAAQAGKFEFPLVPCTPESQKRATAMIQDCNRVLDAANGTMPQKSRAQALYGRGRAHVQQLFCGGEAAAFDQAIRDLDAAITLDSGFREAYAARALAYEYQGDHQGAVLDFRESYRRGVPPRWLVERLEIIESAP